MLGYIPMLNNIKISPMTTIKNLSFDPLRYEQNTLSSEDDKKIWDELFGHKATSVSDDTKKDGETSDDENPNANDSATPSLFITLWSALEDIFDYDSVMAFNNRSDAISDEKADKEPHGNSDDDNGDGEDGETGSFMAANAMTGIAAVRQMLFGGIRYAEEMLLNETYTNLNAVQADSYFRRKNSLMSTANLRRAHHFSLTSSQWTALGVILVDNVLRSLNLVIDFNKCSDKADEWSDKLVPAFNRIIQKNSVELKGVDLAEFNVLRNYFRL